jgi:GH15 family glucan-1,4-alpha-glucosidase
MKELEYLTKVTEWRDHYNSNNVLIGETFHELYFADDEYANDYKVMMLYRVVREPDADLLYEVSGIDIE